MVSIRTHLRLLTRRTSNSSATYLVISATYLVIVHVSFLIQRPAGATILRRISVARVRQSRKHTRSIALPRARLRPIRHAPSWQERLLPWCRKDGSQMRAAKIEDVLLEDGDSCVGGDRNTAEQIRGIVPRENPRRAWPSTFSVARPFSATRRSKLGDATRRATAPRGDGHVSVGGLRASGKGGAVPHPREGPVVNQVKPMPLGRPGCVGGSWLTPRRSLYSIRVIEYE